MRMKFVKKLMMLAIILVIVSGCSTNENTEISKLNKQIETLNLEIKGLKDINSQLEKISFESDIDEATIVGSLLDSTLMNEGTEFEVNVYSFKIFQSEVIVIFNSKEDLLFKDGISYSIKYNSNYSILEISEF